MFLLFDIGGTKTRIATTTDLMHYDEPIKFSTQTNFQDGMQIFCEKVHTLLDRHPIEGMAGGIRGLLNHEKTAMTSDPGGALNNWVGRNIVDHLKHEFGAPVFLENDTAVVGLGEATRGAGKGYDIVAYHTVSTGVGGARIVRKQIDTASAGFEPGHQVLDVDRSVLGPGVQHTLENLISGTAMEKRFGCKPYEVDQEHPVWDEYASYLARGLKNTIAYWSPDVIVLGGSMIVGDPRIFLSDIVKHTRKLTEGNLPCPPILDATLKDEGGLYGAMALLKQHMS